VTTITMQCKRAILYCFTLSASSDAFGIANTPQAVVHQTDIVIDSSLEKYSSIIPLTPSTRIPSQKDLLSSTPSEIDSYFGSSLMLSAVSNNLADTVGAYIADINYDGKVPKTEADEYVVVKNGSKTPTDISGYYIYVASTGTQGATFYFPKGTPPLGPGKTVRVYTNEIHKETGGFSYGSGKAVWSNNGGLAVMKDGKGKKICEFKYKPEAAAKPITK
jgi:hypothetical protein